MSDSNTSPKVLCAGILVADIVVPPMPRLPASGELLASDDFLLETGGCAANVATGLARLGIQASVNGTVGTDAFGDFLIKELSERGIDTSHVRRSPYFGTSKTVVLPVIGEDRRFIHTFGANSDFNEKDIALDTLREGGVFYLGGLLIMPALKSEGVARLFAEARSRGIATVLDVVVPVGDATASMEYLRNILPHTDLFLPNDEEAHALTGEEDVERQADCFLEAGCKTTIITQGSKGTLLKNQETTLYADTYPINFVDGSGSGDAFAAGYITGMVEQWDLKRTLTFASAIGASACTKLGCTSGVFNREQADRMMQEYLLNIPERRK